LPQQQQAQPSQQEAEQPQQQSLQQAVAQPPSPQQQQAQPSQQEAEQPQQQSQQRVVAQPPSPQAQQVQQQPQQQPDMQSSVEDQWQHDQSLSQEAHANANADADGPICPICQQAIGEEELKTLPCGHDMHDECIMNWQSTKGLPIDQCCPYKCSALGRAVAPVEEIQPEQQASRYANEASPLSAQAVAQAIAEAREAAGA
jgi:DNA mismatch repair ATPase MutL